MNKLQSDIKAKLHVAIQRAGKDGMEYLHGDISQAEYHLRQQILEDMLYVHLAGLEPTRESEVV